MWKLSQNSSESVEKFLTRVEKKALRAGVSGEDLRLAIIAGLRPGIRAQVSVRKPESVNDIRRFGLEAEANEEPGGDLPTQEALKRLEAKLDSLSMNEMRSSSSPPASTYKPPEMRAYTPWQRGRGQAGRGRSLGRGTGPRYGQPPEADPAQHPTFNCPRYSSAPRGYQRFPNYGRGGNFRQPENLQQQSDQGGQCLCSNCARVPGNYYALGKQCYFCGRLNHLSVCCRSVPSSNQ